ncbi:hypothetical protein NUW54_g4213 [Trametes sanguinea]|uniref:Uncharacterized protein n=1 Tax=Trametes sanguinea TaxID=158606 RepID=A0ACC1Q127_9APHY|nr:hypothetical protein NUW54_g4213 [Trametes sanguinea]
MSYYPPHSTPGTTYPYASYHPQTAGAYAHPQASGAYPTTPYQPYAPPTAVTSYGTAWPYHHGYSYYPQQQHQQQTPVTTPRPAADRLWTDWVSEAAIRTSEDPSQVRMGVVASWEGVARLAITGQHGAKDDVHTVGDGHEGLI